MNKLGPGTVYTETVVFSPPEAYVNGRTLPTRDH